ncbi:hypothetical protein ACHAWX_000082, partial [Stephanocyclus meneghinianus]
MTKCMGDVASGKFFPHWSGDNNEGCLLEANSVHAPEYMRRSELWLHDTLDECCAAHFGYKLADCQGQSAAGSNKWYVDWSTFRCVKDCSSAGTGSDVNGCGGLAD